MLPHSLFLSPEGAKLVSLGQRPIAINLKLEYPISNTEYPSDEVKKR
jgi:hypothetical protein